MTIAEASLLSSAAQAQDHWSSEPIGSVSIVLSPPLANVLNEIVQESGQSAEDLIRMSFGLLKIALQAKSEGKSVGIAKEGEPMRTIIDIF